MDNLHNLCSKRLYTKNGNPIDTDVVNIKRGFMNLVSRQTSEISYSNSQLTCEIIIVYCDSEFMSIFYSEEPKA